MAASPTSILDAVASDPSLSTTLRAVRKAGLESYLSNSDLSITLFAPNCACVG